MVILDGTGSHDTRDTASTADQHRDEGFSGKAELTEDTVHDKGNTCHVAASLKECKEDKQDQDLRNESKYGADTGYDTIHDQSVQPSVCYTGCAKYVLKKSRDTRNPDTVASRIRSFTVPFFKNCCRICKISSCCSCFFFCKCLFVFDCIGYFCVCSHGRSELFQCCGCCVCIKVIRLCVKHFYQAVISGVLCKCIYNCRCIIELACIAIVSASADTGQIPTIAEYTVICPVCCDTADCCYRYIIYDIHHQCEDRECQPAVGHDPVDLV